MVKELLLNFELIEGEENGFSLEFIRDKKAKKINLFLPWFVMTLTTREE
jgi:hypothetical protein